MNSSSESTDTNPPAMRLLPGHRPGDQKRIVTRVVLVVFTALVVAPAVFVGILPGERERWLVAEIREAELNGEYALALSKLDQLIDTEPEEVVMLRIRRVELLIELGRSDDAVSEAQQIVESHPEPLIEIDDDDEILDAYEHYGVLAEAYQSAGQFEDAAETWRDVRRQTRDMSSEDLTNILAYANALAGEELFPSMMNLTLVIRRNYDEASLFHHSAYLHFIFLRDGRRYFEEHPDQRQAVFELALADYNSAIAARKQALDEFERGENAESLFEILGIAGLATSSDDDSEQAEDVADGDDETVEHEVDEDAADEDAADENDAETSNESDDEPEEQSRSSGSVRRDLALVYAHRAQLFDLVGDDENAKRDWEIVAELGFSRRKLSRQVRNANKGYQSVGQMSAWLDTRAFLLLKLGQASPAEKQLTIAIRFMESMVSAGRFMEVRRSTQSPDVRIESRQVQELEQGLAVLLYHRYLARIELDDQAGAEDDADRIRALGYEPGEALY